MIVKMHSTRGEEEKILVLIATDHQDREALEDIVKAGAYISVGYTPKHAISKVSIPVYYPKRAT